MSTTPPGWQPDPYGRAQVRWWSGTSWTDHVATNGQEFLDPPVAGPAQTAPAPTPGGVAAPAAATAKPGSSTKTLAIVGAVALLVGGLGGWMMRGDGDDGGGGGGGGGGATAGTLTTPILTGLASLNSYQWQMSATTVGPTDADRSEVAASGASDSQAELRYVKNTTTESSADYPEPDTSSSETWTTADTTCEFDGEEYSAEAANPFMADMGDVLTGVFDIVIPAGNATKVGTETIAGVQADHYTFSIEGLGAGSGTQVDQNTGELWVAVDGGYLLKYQVTTSLRSTPADGSAVETYSLALTLELTSVNQPVGITVPAGCSNPST